MRCKTLWAVAVNRVPHLFLELSLSFPPWKECMAKLSLMLEYSQIDEVLIKVVIEPFYGML